ncbi:protein-glutamate methylesterase/protein-glutamine glutaminase [Teredinibacter purpureus]|uniref:protein-glutamate methylesterase/protein-glutamine glutaminase n=1 Tax=Teredinibacter purpureus TaxID=2731756 RepID=UPI0005F8054C|nr:chemotaxis response regulator protein-glutamate methylesterase [Teredinibacter purpureus]
MQKRVKVLIVDDSALIRALLNEVLSSHPGIEVVGAATDPYEARELIKKFAPDVLTLDIEMPRMNGIAFLKNLMRLRPMPVVMISTLTQDGAPATLEALALGAVDFVPKPKNEGGGALELYRDVIVEKVLCAASANIAASAEASSFSDHISGNRDLASSKKLKSQFICALGASTGGTEAIKEVVLGLPENGPPIVIAQHIPEAFSASFARRVNSAAKMTVVEAKHNQKIEQGSVYIAPGNAHLRVEARAGGYYCSLGRDDVINRHRPSVEALFDSVTKAAGAKAMGIILTGMGSDGAAALLRMKQVGAVTVAQDEGSSVVWGMPGAAVKMGAASKILPLNKIGRYLLTNAFK